MTIVSGIPLSNGTTERYFFAPGTTFTPQQYNVSIASNVFNDSSSETPNNTGETTSFTVVTPTAQIVDPFSANSGAVDVNTINQEVDATSGEHYVDVIYTAAPAASLNYKSILAPTSPVVTLSVNGTPVALATDPIPLTLSTNTVGSVVATPATGYALTDSDLNTELADQNVTEFRYLITAPNYTFPTGTATVVVNSNWNDTAGNTPPAVDQTFTINGPTASLASPSAGATVDVSTLNQQGYLQVAFNPAAGDTINPSTIKTSDLTLSGSGAAGVTIASTAPTLVAGTTSTYQFAVTGMFQPGPVNVNFAANSFADTSGVENLALTSSFTVGGPTATLASPSQGGTVGLTSLNSQGYVSVLFTPDSGGAIDPSTITAGMISVSGPGAGTVAFTAAPQVQQDGDTYEFPFTGQFVPAR